MLRDFACPSCEYVLEDQYVDYETLTVDARCPKCGPVSLEAVCNGGLRSRYRFADWPSDPEFWRGQSKVLGAEAVDSEGNAVRRYHSGTREIGAPMADDDRYKNGSDTRETRRDIIKHSTRRKRGSLPIVCDLGKQNA